MHKILKSIVSNPKVYIIEKEYSSDLKESMKNTTLTSNLPHHTCIIKMHRNGPLELARIFSSHYSLPQVHISLSDNGADYFLECLITLNLLRDFRVKPDLSAYTYVYGPYNFNKYHMALPGTFMIVHNKLGNRMS